jgi:putative hydrolase of the HAD superfamily
MSELKARPDLRHVDTWIFDLDNTLYPPGTEFMALIEGRIKDFVARQTGLPPDEAWALQKRYLDAHGTALAGLMAFHGVEPHAFLDEIHDVSLDSLQPDAELRAALGRLPGRRLVFTNGSAWHAARVLERLQLADIFDEVFHLEAAQLISKPDPAAFDLFIDAHAVTPKTSAFFEDRAINLAPAARLGMTTVLVGPKACDEGAEFVAFRTPTIPPFVAAARLKERSA